MEIQLTSDEQDNLLEKLITYLSEDAFSVVVQEAKTKAALAIEQRVNALLDELLTEKINNLLNNKGFQPTDKYGNPKGEPLTLENVAIQAAEKFLNDKVDQYGKPSEYGRMLRIEWYVQKYAVEGLETKIKKEIEAIKSESVQKAQSVISELIAKKLHG